jgi:ubiquitin-protein ligase
MRIETSAATLSQFFVTLNVGEGPYMPTTLTFWVKIFDDFPANDSFRVRCTKRVFHPSVHAESGKIAVPVDFSGWRGGGSLRFLLDALRKIFIAPAELPIASPAANEVAAALLRSDPDEFRRTVRLTLAGGPYRGVQYDSMHSSSTPSGVSAAADCLPRGSTPDAITVEVMQLEVMKEQFKQKISGWMRHNTSEITDLRSAARGAF